MLKQLKYILNSFNDEQLEDIDLYVDGKAIIEQIVVEKQFGDYSIDLISEDAEVKINDLIDKEKRE